jgi:hypothetical protein
VARCRMIASPRGRAGGRFVSVCDHHASGQRLRPTCLTVVRPDLDTGFSPRRRQRCGCCRACSSRPTASVAVSQQFMTLDHLSGGRAIVGSAGHVEAGSSPRSRLRLRGAARDASTPCGAFANKHAVHGQVLRLQGHEAAPRPAQQPIPIWVGGSSPRCAACRAGDGWIPRNPSRR